MEDWRKNYDSWKSQTPEETKGLKEVYECSCCYCGIYEGEDYYDIDGTIICDACIGEFKKVAGE